MLLVRKSRHLRDPLRLFKFSVVNHFPDSGCNHVADSQVRHCQQYFHHTGQEKVPIYEKLGVFAAGRPGRSEMLVKSCAPSLMRSLGDAYKVQSQKALNIGSIKY